MEERDEIALTLEQVRDALDEMVVRGLRTGGPAEHRRLANLQRELARVGAAHLAERLATLQTALEAEDRAAASALLRAQASLRVLERFFTKEAVLAELAALAETDAE